MIRNVVVIGGAGFVGSHLVDKLVRDGLWVRVLDNLDPQVHPDGLPPAYLNTRAEFVQLDLRDVGGLLDGIREAEAIFYLAGAVGVGDSMFRIRHYADVNVLGAANLLDILANQKHSVKKIVLASSVTVYGEGKYSCPVHGHVFPSVRSAEKSASQQWELRCPIQENSGICGETLTPHATDEERPLSPLSIYAMTKRAQEEMFLVVGRTYGIPVAVLRYFNVYGSRQALSNPYTGVAKIFASQIAQGRVPLIYEDGFQTRDFVHVQDVVQANMLALHRDEANGQIFNVGTGRPTNILEMANAVADSLGRKLAFEPSHQYRAGDVRHCWADITKIRTLLGYEPRMIFPAGLEDVSGSAQSATSPVETAVRQAQAELSERGLVSRATNRHS
jgi:dTDP-L-rhamnose 4-epimerase